MPDQTTAPETLAAWDRWVDGRISAALNEAADIVGDVTAESIAHVRGEVYAKIREQINALRAELLVEIQRASDAAVHSAASRLIIFNANDPARTKQVDDDATVVDWNKAKRSA
jgi:hypothetical protein